MTHPLLVLLHGLCSCVLYCCALRVLAVGGFLCQQMLVSVATACLGYHDNSTAAMTAE